VTPLLAADALHEPVRPVSAEARPSELGDVPGDVVYAVFTESPDNGCAGAFLGLVTHRDIAPFASRIFADLLPKPQPEPVATDTSIEDVLKRMDRDGADVMAVVDSTHDFAGAITRASLFGALLRREHALSDEARELRARQQEEQFREGQNRALKLLATGATLGDVLTALVHAIENQFEGRPCSVLLLDRDGRRLRSGAAPSLPDAYNRAIDGVEIGPNAGSCGTAAYRREPVIVEDIEHDPLWITCRELALAHGLRACWSRPVCASDGRVLGTFAVYARVSHRPSSADLALTESAAHLAGIAIERKQAEDHLRDSEARLRAILTNAADGVVTIDERGIVESFNPAAERIFSYAAGDVIGRNVKMLMPEPYQSEHDAYVQRYVDGGRGRIIGIGPREVVGRRRDGTTFPIDLAISEMRLDERHLFIGIVRDITERKHAAERLDYLAHYDALTGLPNRALLNDRLRQTTIAAGRHERVVTVMFLDLDRFKTINDTLGHDVGDLVLRTVADRLTACVREGDTVARLGGDEYAIILADMAQSRDAMGIAQKILDRVREPISLAGHELVISASIGITLYPADDARIEHLLKNADTAMYRAKEQGRNTYQFYTADMNAEAVLRLTLETDLRRALEHGEFLLHYQPQIDLKSGALIGMEALIRWRHPGEGLVPPATFIPLAEDTGLIVPIGQWVMRTACAQNKAWQDAGLPALRVSVNVSARQFRQKSFPETVAAILRETGLGPAYLELEVTESLMMDHVEAAIMTLKEFHGMGIKLSIDDFGTGYSSLSYLRRFPIDSIKIDRSFIGSLATDSDQTAIVVAMISLAHTLRLRVVAEGVETAGQAAFLCEHGCDEGQGYLFSKPLAAELLVSLLRTGTLPIPAP
jgi:diguanylate cyclase (GGDEF)-like protein/PAS domain S-box-containing protein